MMPFTDKTITPDELRLWSLNLVTNYHSDHMDEPYDGAGYCTCWLCQEIAPRFSAGADTLEAVIAERDELLALVAELHGALEFARTRERPSWAYEWLFGKKSNPHKHAALLKLDEVVVAVEVEL